MRFDRKKFFDNYRSHFKTLTQVQVNGLNSLLANYEKYYGWWDNIDQIGNSLAQIKHESAHSFQPVVEGFYLGDSTKPNYFQGNTDKVKRFQQSLRYYPHFGMGHIQLTWLENYQKLDALIRKYFPEIVQQFELRTGRKFDLAKDPAQALDADVSFAIMTIGMHKGTFRAGHTLDRYIYPGHADHFGAREIVNGDKNYRIKGSNVKIGDSIAATAKAFSTILRASLIAESAVPTVTTAPSDNPAISDPSKNILEIPQSEPPTNGATIQNAENIVNLPGSEPPAPPPQEKEMVAPSKDGATASATKMTIMGIALPGFVVAGIKALQDAIANGYISAAEVGQTVLGFIKENQKYVFLLIALLIVLMIIKKIVKQITFWIQMISHAVPKANSITVVPAEVEKKPWWRIW